ncbi:maestro heat-like repeat-containing protein family member 6 isoform X2 [Taeniopygia guttata]|uniref:Maestro/Maestro-like HEAT-repeats domain-containing protein n=1 Tax=Taeniopygia guttata TaxID=59729 RepID=H0ZLL2_TAEGU|nr:maestro heat-like repeat-containing protein family member 6 isoform X1 [Taeniopygia guttata]
MAETPPSLPKKVEKCPSAAPPQQQNDLPQFQLLEKAAGRDQTQGPDSTHSCWHSVCQMFTNLTGTRCREMSSMFTKAAAEPGPTATQSIAPAPSLDLFGDRVVSSPSQVPGFVRNMHQRLVSNGPPDEGLFMDILRLTEAHPTDVAVTLLRCAPSCDRAAAIMWKTIASSRTTLEKVLPTLLSVMEGWPLQKMYTSDGDNEDVFALAATRVLWEILRLPWCPEPFVEYFPNLFVALLFQVYISTEQVSEDINTLWKRCQEENGLPTNINRFVVNTVRALLHHLRCLDLLMAVERKCAWDTLLCADTHHYAVGLLAREMRRVSRPFCSGTAFRLLRWLSREEPRWDLAALAFLVEVLDCLDLSEWGNLILEIMTKYLQSKSMERCHLALKGLVVLSKDPSMAKKLCSLSERLVELLRNEDTEVVKRSLSVFTNLLLNKDILTSSSTAPKLAEVLRPLFDHDNSHVQQLSIRLYRDVMETVVEQGKKPLKMLVSQSLLPLFFHCHDENQRVAQASRETLLCAVTFLKKRKDLQRLLKTDDLWSFAERLLAEDRSRAAEHLRRALPYLQSPQEPLREAAVRTAGIAGLLMRGQPEELQLICEALQALRTDDSPSKTNLRVQVMLDERAASLGSSSGSRQPGQHQIP